MSRGIFKIRVVEDVLKLIKAPVDAMEISGRAQQPLGLGQDLVPARDVRSLGFQFIDTSSWQDGTLDPLFAQFRVIRPVSCERFLYE